MANLDENEFINDTGNEPSLNRRSSTGTAASPPALQETRRSSSPRFFTFRRQRLEIFLLLLLNKNISGF